MTEGGMPAGAQLLYGIVKSMLTGQESLDVVRDHVERTGGFTKLTPETIAEVVERFRQELAPTPSDVSYRPRLLVDWGDLPRVGHQVRPEFSLLCPQYESRPEIEIHVDDALDHDPLDKLRTLQAAESGGWTFHVPVRMTSGGADCLPGSYVLGFSLYFRHAPAALPRFYRCSIRLKAPKSSDQGGGVLEIDGDGQSIVNLQGYNLAQFSKVMLKGGQSGVINLNNAFAAADQPAKPAQSADQPTTTFSYEFKEDTEKQSQLPRVSQSFSNRSHLESAGLFFEDGRRYLIKCGSRMTFGRNRDNDVVLRFLPRSEEHDGHSRNISRTHFEVELVDEGIEIRDQSSKGMEVRYSVVDKLCHVSSQHSGDPTPIDLGVTGSVPKQFRLTMLMLAPDRLKPTDDLHFWDELYAELIGGQLTRVSRLALKNRLSAVRFDRTENLAGEESYVLLLREAILGGSQTQSTITLKNCGPKPQARLLYLDRAFWIEVLPGAGSVSVNGVSLEPRTLTPLSLGMQIVIGDERFRFDRPAQLHLD